MPVSSNKMALAIRHMHNMRLNSLEHVLGWSESENLSKTHHLRRRPRNSQRKDKCFVAKVFLIPDNFEIASIDDLRDCLGERKASLAGREEVTITN